MDITPYILEPIGIIQSEVKDPAAAPKQGIEGAPSVWIVLDARYAAGCQGLAVGDRLVVLTWLHMADRDLQLVHPRDDLTAPLKGVFATRSADRPNPIGLHPVTVLVVDGLRFQVNPMEAIDGTPVLDIKPEI